MRQSMRQTLTFIIVWLSAAISHAEMVDVKNQGAVDLDPFVCNAVTGSYINRICYDELEGYMLVQFGGVWYHHCGIDTDTIAALVGAESVARQYSASLKGKFGCQANRMPSY